MPDVETNGIRMHYEERGAGEPLLLLMGITAPGSVWEKHADYWQRDFRCIMPDNRGVGLSDKPAGPYTTALMADDCAGLLAALGIAGARVVGCSMGSAIAQELVLRHPGLVRSLVLMCPWARCDRYARDVFQHMVHIKGRLLPQEFAAFIQLLIFAKRHWDDDEAHRGLLDGRDQAALDPFPQPAHALAAQAAACTAHDALDRLPEVRRPTLVIGGRSDIFTPPWMAEEVAGAVPGADLHLYEGAGHAFHWERIEDFNPRVREWLLAH